MTKSFYSFVMDNKEVGKMQNLLANCTKSMKPELMAFVKRWKPYHFLWKNDKSSRELMEMDILEFESTLSCLAHLDSNLLVEPDFIHLGNCIAVSTEKLKYGLAVEIKCELIKMDVFMKYMPFQLIKFLFTACTHKIGQAMKKKYKREMDYVYAVMSEMDRKLDRNIRDLDDVRMIMDTLGKIREQEVDMELKIEPIEVNKFIVKNLNSLNNLFFSSFFFDCRKHSIF